MGTNQFAEMLKYYLMLNDKSQKDLVDDLGFDKSTVSSWCSGNRVPKIDVIIDIAKYLHVNVGDLIEDNRNDETYYLNPKHVTWHSSSSRIRNTRFSSMLPGR